MPYLTITYDPTRTSSSSTSITMGQASGNPSRLQGFAERPIQWIPPDEAYYWTDAWQDGEIETLASLAMGQGRVFDAADDLIAWLRSTDD